MNRTTFIAACFCLIAATATAHAEGLADHIRRIDPPQKMLPLVYEDAQGGQHALSDQRGHFVLLNIWATWCGPCVSEMPSLDALQAEMDPGKLTVIALSEDHGDAVVDSFYKIHKITHLPVAIDRAGRAPTALRLQGLPTTLLIDPQGREIARMEGDTDWHSTAALDFLHAQMR